MTSNATMNITDASWFNAEIVRLNELCRDLSGKSHLSQSEIMDVMNLTMDIAEFVRSQAVVGNDAIVEKWIEFLAMDEV